MRKIVELIDILKRDLKVENVKKHWSRPASSFSSLKSDGQEEEVSYAKQLRLSS